jgi:hypothetical protein
MVPVLECTVKYPILQKFSHLIYSSTNFKSYIFCYLQFTGEVSEAQRGELLYEVNLRPCNSRIIVLELNSVSRQ